MKSWVNNLSLPVKYGLINTLIGFVIGIFLAVIAIGSGYSIFIFAAPLAIFITGYYAWKLIVRPDSKTYIFVLTGLLTGSVSHIVTFLIIGFLQLLCYLILGGCTNSLEDPPGNVFSLIPGSFFLSFFSLMLFGWITISFAIFTAFITRKFL